MLFIKTNKPYKELNSEDVVDSTNQPLMEASLIWDSETEQWIVRFGSEKKVIRDVIYRAAQRSSEEELIKIDFATSRASRIPANRLQKETKMQQVSEPAVTVFDPDSVEVETTRLKDINFDPRMFQPIRTGTYMDEFVSYKGGFMPGINIMLTGDPGVGKSSNLMDILVNVRETDDTKRVLYVSAEMNEIDVKEFEQYYPGLGEIDFLYIGNYVTNPDLNIKPYQALISVLNQGWDLVVMDSLVEVQSMVQEDLALPQKKAEKWMLDLMKTHNSGHNKKNIYTAFLCIQQKNKGGSYVGSKRLEHMTSAFLELCWDKKEKGKRYMMFEKNRKGKEKVKLYYNFAKEGGLVYDEVRHTKELQILERLQTTSEFAIDELTPSDLEALWADFAEETIA
jgi:predicted ATP-dependent serine protease